jgi:hypothetical protein
VTSFACLQFFLAKVRISFFLDNENFNINHSILLKKNASPDYCGHDRQRYRYPALAENHK